MKYEEILEAVLFMNDTENQGMIKIVPENEKDFETILDTLEAIFGEIDEEESIGIDNISWGSKYFWATNPLCSRETLRRSNPEQHCYPVICVLYLKEGKEINLYEIEE